SYRTLFRSERHRRVVDRRYGHGHGGRGGAAIAVADRVSDRRGTVEVGRRAEEQVRATHNDHRAIGGRGANDGQRITIQIAVVGQRRDGDGHVFRRARAVVGPHRSVIDRYHGHGHGGGGGAAVAVADGVGDCRRAVIVGRRGEEQVRATHDEDGSSVRCSADD